MQLVYSIERILSKYKYYLKVSVLSKQQLKERILYIQSILVVFVKNQITSHKNHIEKVKCEPCVALDRRQRQL